MASHVVYFSNVGPRSSLTYHSDVSTKPEDPEKKFDVSDDEDTDPMRKTPEELAKMDPVQAELRFLRLALQEQGKALGALEQRQRSLNESINGRMDTLESGINDIKSALNGVMKYGGIKHS